MPRFRVGLGIVDATVAEIVLPARLPEGALAVDLRPGVRGFRRSPVVRAGHSVAHDSAAVGESLGSADRLGEVEG